MICSNCSCTLSSYYHYAMKEYPGMFFCSKCYEKLHFNCDICKNFKIRDFELDDSDWAEMRGMSTVCIECVTEEKKECDKRMAKIKYNT